MKHPHAAAMLAALLAGSAGLAQAQASDLTVSLGLKAWHTQWTTFSYDTNAGGDPVLTQVPAKDKLVVVPQLSMRWRDFTGSLSAYPSTNHDFVAGGRGTRKELDLNVGYFVAPSVAVTLGYKKLSQRDGDALYELDGPVLGVSATAPLGHGYALYGTLGIGRMKDTGASTVHFKADYQLSELGLAYNLAIDRLPRTLTFTLGYRTQVLSSKEALGAQDGRDLTQGLTFGLVASF